MISYAVFCLKKKFRMKMKYWMSNKIPINTLTTVGKINNKKINIITKWESKTIIRVSNGAIKGVSAPNRTIIFESKSRTKSTKELLNVLRIFKDHTIFICSGSVMFISIFHIFQLLYEYLTIFLSFIAITLTCRLKCLKSHTKK